MRKVVGGKVYNTATATQVAKVEHLDLGELFWYQERLHRTRVGDYFLMGVGGDCTRWRDESGIVPLNPKQTEYWCQKHGVTLEVKDA